MVPGKLNNINPRSIKLILWKGSGVIKAQTPRTRNILKMHEPIAFPIAISMFFLYNATSEVTNSGNEVAEATMVRPMVD
jgi:hypothetical protein